ncbi:hypothetical protein HJG60_008178 [Phyllostomus discolor]|uniref:Uncharacterized protein n=1 Tax=Phyllostomus discolor TaxID=89673 RepID=A0A834DP83_9CHIR|nr:hypothetical protein HJG60_008178 [Phyllostomus discolor]
MTRLPCECASGARVLPCRSPPADCCTWAVTLESGTVLQPHALLSVVLASARPSPSTVSTWWPGCCRSLSVLVLSSTLQDLVPVAPGRSFHRAEWLGGTGLKRLSLDDHETLPWTCPTGPLGVGGRSSGPRASDVGTTGSGDGPGHGRTARPGRKVSQQEGHRI